MRGGVPSFCSVSVSVLIPLNLATRFSGYEPKRISSVGSFCSYNQIYLKKIIRN